MVLEVSLLHCPASAQLKFVLFFHAGGPHLLGVPEEHGCRRWRLLSAVCGTADVTGGNDGHFLTKMIVNFQTVTASFIFPLACFWVIIAVLVYNNISSFNWIFWVSTLDR